MMEHAPQTKPTLVLGGTGKTGRRVANADDIADTDGVQRALGRQPRDFADYARDAAATGVWNASQVAA
jgi:hypothetical protein